MEVNSHWLESERKRMEADSNEYESEKKKREAERVISERERYPGLRWSSFRKFSSDVYSHSMGCPPTAHTLALTPWAVPRQPILNEKSITSIALLNRRLACRGISHGNEFEFTGLSGDRPGDRLCECDGIWTYLSSPETSKTQNTNQRRFRIFGCYVILIKPESDKWTHT